MKNDANKEIGARIRAARENAGISQMILANALGFESATAIALIEKGLRKVKAEDLHKLADLLHHDIGYFLGQPSTHVPDVKVALRADKDLTDEDKKAVLHFIDIAKKRHEKR